MQTILGRAGLLRRGGDAEAARQAAAIEEQGRLELDAALAGRDAAAVARLTHRWLSHAALLGDETFAAELTRLTRAAEVADWAGAERVAAGVDDLVGGDSGRGPEGGARDKRD